MLGKRTVTQKWGSDVKGICEYLQQQNSVMYSKYLDYTDAAIRAHQTAQVENEQKDILISQLKSQVYELKQLQNDFLKLNELVASLEDKYSLLLDEKERSDKEHRVKSDIDKNAIIDLKEEIDTLRVHLQKANMQIEDLLRENTAMKRMSDARAQEIQNIRYEIKGVENKNDRSAQENKALALTVRNLKEEKKKLEDECDALSGILDNTIASLKGLEKQVRNSESTNARLNKTLHQAENDHGKLVCELKQKNEEAKKAEGKLKNLSNSLNEMNLSYQNVEQQANRNKNEADRNLANLNNEIDKGKELSAKLASVEASIRAQENELDLIINDEEKLRREHFAKLERNKSLNGEIDRLLSLISEYEQVNKELIDEIEIYIDQDEQARAILNRRESMREIIESTLRKAALTGDLIKHLKY